jgi:Na+:H+ antiporter, NhaA family
MLQRFFRSEPAAAIVLFVAAALAMVVANSPLHQPYDEVLHATVLGISIQHWINDGLMAIFFLLVGLEVKQEVRDGALSTWRRRVLPGLAALGGMAMPALIFLTINARSEAHLGGWAIPAATDIAFALGVLALLGSRVPASLRVLLVGIAILDDLGAILIIAAFYTSTLQVAWLGLAGVILAVLAALNRLRVAALAPYLGAGLLLWIAMYQSGIHATLAGVVLAFAIPAQSVSEQHRSPMQTTEHALDRWVSFLIVPLFGFANAGITFAGLGRSEIIGSLPLGIALGLFVGKQVGVLGAIWLAVRSGVAPRPPGVGWAQLHALAVMCGIGFTMSLFIGGLAFADAPDLMAATKIGVVGGSVCSAVVGALLMLVAVRQPAGRRVSAYDA